MPKSVQDVCPLDTYPTPYIPVVTSFILYPVYQVPEKAFLRGWLPVLIAHFFYPKQTDALLEIGRRGILAKEIL